MANLLSETIDSLTNTGYTQADVAWVGSADGTLALAWQEVEAIFNVSYDSGYGGQEIASDLVIAMNDGTWFERHEYDGSECWHHNTPPQRQEDAKPFRRVTGHGIWTGLATQNAE